MRILLASTTGLLAATFRRSFRRRRSLLSFRNSRLPCPPFSNVFMLGRHPAVQPPLEVLSSSRPRRLARQQAGFSTRSHSITPANFHLRRTFRAHPPGPVRLLP